MGAAGSVQGALPSGDEVVDGHHGQVQVNKEIEAEVNRIKGIESGSVSGSSVSSNARTKLGSTRVSVPGSASDDEDDDRKSVSTNFTRLSTQQCGGGIHSALVTRQPTSDALLSTLIQLPRGGVYVRTRAGAIQFGVPPDTIKDSMALGLSVPSVFVVPQERFNLELGINVAEIEFPAYFNFFFLQKYVRLMVTKDQEKDIRVAFEETLEGPADEFLYQDDEYGKFADPSVFAARPDLRKEIDYFKEPRNGRVISCDTLIHFIRFDEFGKGDLSDLKGPEAPAAAGKPAVPKDSKDEAAESHEGDDDELGDSVGMLPSYSLIIQDLRNEERYAVIENGREIASVPYSLASFVPSPEILERQHRDIIILERELDAQLDVEVSEREAEDKEVEERKDGDREDGQHALQGAAETAATPKGAGRTSSFKALASGGGFVAPSAKLDDDLYCLVSTGTFTPPDFGVTMLGNSHGFDKDGTTTGFIVWMHGYGVAVDPPPHCDAYLMMNGVSPRLVTSVILTHCHADHDAGTFQKILKERRTTLVTTKTIYAHFIRKYSAVSGLDAEFLKRLLDFKEVSIAEPTFLHGGVFEFFYALHALPCIGFKVTCGSKTLSYSGDTFNDPDGLDALQERGIISAERKQALLDFPWDCDLVLHECGVPPIHTPASTLQKLPESVRERLFAVHIADKAAEDAGLRKARAGFDNTITIHNAPRANDRAIHTLQLCAQTDIFRDADIKQCIYLLEMASRHRYRSGYEFSGTVGGIFFIMAEGVLKVEREGKEAIILKLGDYFGEISAMNGNMEHMKLTAITDVEIIDINKFAFNQFLQSCPEAHKRLLMLEAMRSKGFSAVLKRNSVFSHLSFPQKTALQSLTRTPRTIERGATICGQGDLADHIIVVQKGEFLVTSEPHLIANAEASSRSVLSGGGESGASAETTKKPARRRSLSGVFVSPVAIRAGAIFIPSNVYKYAVLGKCEEEASKYPSQVAFVAHTSGSIFEIDKEGFRDFLLRNPGIQLTLMKHSTGLVI